jgi:hypothetical protein
MCAVASRSILASVFSLRRVASPRLGFAPPNSLAVGAYSYRQFICFPVDAPTALLLACCDSALLYWVA